MKNKCVTFVSLFLLALGMPSLAQEDKLGKVNFPNSCDAKVQTQFERGRCNAPFVLVYSGCRKDIS